MKRTHATPLIGLALAGAVFGYLLEMAFVASGKPVVVPPLSMPVTLVAIAAIVIVFAIPIRRAVHAKTKQHINPFTAMRIAVLSKASSLAGSLLTGGGIGILVYLLTRTVLPPNNTIWLAVALTIGAVILLVAGLIAEHLCTIPPSDSNESETTSLSA